MILTPAKRPNSEGKKHLLCIQEKKLSHVCFFLITLIELFMSRYLLNIPKPISWGEGEIVGVVWIVSMCVCVGKKEWENAQIQMISMHQKIFWNLMFLIYILKFNDLVWGKYFLVRSKGKETQAHQRKKFQFGEQDLESTILFWLPSVLLMPNKRENALK